VLVRRGSHFSHHENQPGISVTSAEFFVMENYRRKGIGIRVAVNLFNRFHDRWEVAQVANNIAGQAF
jgi:predicted acetyltransferase